MLGLYYAIKNHGFTLHLLDRSTFLQAKKNATIKWRFLNVIFLTN